MFVSQQLDRDVVIARAPSYWGDSPTSRASASLSSLTPPPALSNSKKVPPTSKATPSPPTRSTPCSRDPHLAIEDGPGTVLNYIVFNSRDPILRDARVRTAIALAINRPLIIQALYRGEARLAESLLPSAALGLDRRHRSAPVQSRRRQHPPRSGWLPPRRPRRPPPHRHENLQR